METVNGINYEILAEVSISDIKNQNFKYKSTLTLRRLNGNKKYNAIRKQDGTIEIM